MRVLFYLTPPWGELQESWWGSIQFITLHSSSSRTESLLHSTIHCEPVQSKKEFFFSFLGERVAKESQTVVVKLCFNTAKFNS